MKVRIRTSETTATAALSAFIQRRLEYALAVHDDAIDTVDAWILGIDRGAQGPASYCKIDVTLVNGARVGSEATEKDVHLAVHRAADRAGWEVARCLGRQLRRRGGAVSSAVPGAAPLPGNPPGLAQAV